jgi:hypothetical protein
MTSLKKKNYLTKTNRKCVEFLKYLLKIKIKIN